MHDIETRAAEAGFELAAYAKPEDIVCKQEMRDLCNADSCPNYGTCWSCPPGAGSFADCAARIAASAGGVLVQTVRHDIDFNDAEQLAAVRDLHNARLDKLAETLRGAYDHVLEFTTGGCSICEQCSYPDAPCRQPEKQRLALSAHGVDVTATCANIDMEYAFENGTIRFVGLVLV